MLCTKNWLFFIFIALASNMAHADWTRVILRDDAEAQSFIDYQTIRKDGNSRTVWQLINFTSPKPNKTRSIRIKYEYDCKTERVRGLAVSSHSQLFATGSTFGDGDEITPWQSIPPGTPWDVFLKIVCSK